MCCIFTYISWMFDFIQRIWSFLMSCCIGGAVCALFLIAVASGIAFGYHYSLSEFLNYKDSTLSVSITRDVNNPLDEDNWWPEDPKKSLRQNEPNFLEPTTEEDFGVVSEDITETESTTTTEQIIPKKLLFTITTRNIPLEKVIKQHPAVSGNEMKSAMDRIYHIKKSRKPTKRTKKRTTATYARVPTKRKTVKPFEYISDYEDILMTARTFTPIALFTEYDETEIENWRRVAQSMLYDYPEIHVTDTRSREEAYPIYDNRATRKEYTGPRKKFKSAYFFIDPSYPATRAITSTKRLKYIFTSTPIKLKITEVIEVKETVTEKAEGDNKTQEYLGKVLTGYGKQANKMRHKNELMI